MITYSENNWLHDVQDCVNELSSNDFTLDDVYQFESRLATLHPDNHNVRAKIRQQLQVLRDIGYIK